MVQNQNSSEVDNDFSRKNMIDQIDDDIYCLKCGYNLRTLRMNGCCPECNMPVRTTVDSIPRNQKIQQRILRLIFLATLGPWFILFAHHRLPELDCVTFFICALLELLGCVLWVVLCHSCMRSSRLKYYAVLLFTLTMTIIHGIVVFFILFITPEFG